MHLLERDTFIRRTKKSQFKKTNPRRSTPFLRSTMEIHWSGPLIWGPLRISPRTLFALCQQENGCLKSQLNSPSPSSVWWEGNSICIFKVSYKNNFRPRNNNKPVGRRRRRKPEKEDEEEEQDAFLRRLPLCARQRRRAHEDRGEGEKRRECCCWLCLAVAVVRPFFFVIESSRRRKQNIFIMSNYVLPSRSLLRDLRQLTTIDPRSVSLNWVIFSVPINFCGRSEDNLTCSSSH